MSRDPSTFDQWASDVQPLIKSFTSVVELFMRPYGSGSESLVVISDQFQGVSQHAAQWASAHPSPVPGIDVALTELGRSYGAMAELLEAQTKNGGEPDWPAVDRQMEKLYRDLAGVRGLIGEHTAE